MRRRPATGRPGVLAVFRALKEPPPLGEAECQVCGASQTAIADRGETHWKVHVFSKQGAEGPGEIGSSFQITTCLRCGVGSPDAIVLGYTNRVRLGFDRRFH